MNCKLYTYVHESNGIAVELLSETEAEESLLHALWRFGKMETVHSSCNGKTKGFIIKAFASEAESAGGE